jgi:hypothetical protein
MQYRDIVRQAEEKLRQANGNRLTIDAAELVKLYLAIPRPQHGDEWGNWKLNSDEGYDWLDFADGEWYWANSPYYIPVAELLADDGLLRWLKHLSEKVWFGSNPENAGNFLCAVFDLRGSRDSRH